MSAKNKKRTSQSIPEFCNQNIRDPEQDLALDPVFNRNRKI